MKLQRNHWILLALVLVLSGEVVHYMWSHWGLITVHSKGLPLSQVIRSIEKQGHVTIKTNMDMAKPVVMYVDEVSLAEAMETLATGPESRWRLAYVVGPDKAAVSGAVSTFSAGEKNEGWRTLYVPLGMFGDEPDVLPDPRKDSWVVKPATESTLQAYLQEASRNVSASFLVKEGFNPPVKSPPKSGAISSALPKLVSSAKGSYQEIFLLQSFNRQADREPRERGEGGEPQLASNFGGDRARGRGGFDRDAREERMQNELAKMSAADRAAAQAAMDKWKQFRDSLKDLTPEQRAQRMQDMMSDPSLQDKMDNANNNRDARRTPQQRISRAQNYLSRKAAAN